MKAARVLAGWPGRWLALLILSAIVSAPARAQVLPIPEPDVIFFGTVVNAPVGTSIALMKPSGPLALDKRSLDAAGGFALHVPLVNLSNGAVEPPDSALLGTVFTLSVNNVPQGTVQAKARGSVYEVDLTYTGTAPVPLPALSQTEPGVTPQPTTSTPTITPTISPTVTPTIAITPTGSRTTTISPTPTATPTPTANGVLVCDVMPLRTDLNSDGDREDFGEFGDNTLDIVDVRAVFRAFAFGEQTPGSDRFKTMNATPLDAPPACGGNSAIDITDVRACFRMAFVPGERRFTRHYSGATCQSTQVTPTP